MEQIKTHKQVIEAINNKARESKTPKLHKLLNVSARKVRDWKYHNKIASKYYGKVAYYAHKHGVKVSVIRLEKMADKKCMP